MACGCGRLHVMQVVDIPHQQMENTTNTLLALNHTTLIMATSKSQYTVIYHCAAVVQLFCLMNQQRWTPTDRYKTPFYKSVQFRCGSTLFYVFSLFAIVSEFYGIGLSSQSKSKFSNTATFPDSMEIRLQRHASLLAPWVR